MEKFLVKVEHKTQRIKALRKFSIIGDPGCDGLGAATMSVLAKALNVASYDLSIIAGDLIPFGSKALYENVQEFIEMVSVNPIYTVCGNHDTEYFNQYFGCRNYLLFNDDIMFIILDNSKKEFSPEAMELCREALAECSAEKVIIVFHIPPPNQVTKNSLSEEKWNAFREIYFEHKRRIQYFVAGHVHSYFEDSVDGIPVIVTGGGGARIETINAGITTANVGHHIVQFEFDEHKKLSHVMINLEEKQYPKELADKVLKQYLQLAFENEVSASFRYRLFAEQAKHLGQLGLSKLFSALSDSEFYHARNHYYVLGKDDSLQKNLESSIKNETYEIHTMYKDFMRYAKTKGHGLAKYSFFDALEAEKIHQKILEEASSDYLRKKETPVAEYYTCSSCGYTMRSEGKPAHCPICGAPQDKII